MILVIYQKLIHIYIYDSEKENEDLIKILANIKKIKRFPKLLLKDYEISENIFGETLNIYNYNTKKESIKYIEATVKIIDQHIFKRIKNDYLTILEDECFGLGSLSTIKPRWEPIKENEPLLLIGKFCIEKIEGNELFISSNKYKLIKNNKIIETSKDQSIDLEKIKDLWIYIFKKTIEERGVDPWSQKVAKEAANSAVESFKNIFYPKMTITIGKDNDPN